MVAVSVDRAVLIYLSRPLTRKQAWIVCLIIWSVAYLITIPTFLESKVKTIETIEQQFICDDDYIPRNNDSYIDQSESCNLKMMTHQFRICNLTIMIHQSKKSRASNLHFFEFFSFIY